MLEPGLEDEPVDGAIAGEVADVAVIPAGDGGLEARNLFGEAERIAARAATASTQRRVRVRTGREH